MYLVFDLDGTIVNGTEGLYNLLCIFDIKDKFKHNPRLTSTLSKPSTHLAEALAKTYDIFISRLAEIETSTPIGLFRPGIFPVLQKALELKDSNIVKGVILYTNNSSRNFVKFVVDIIHKVLPRPIFDDVSDRLDPLRLIDPGTGRPYTRKTWHEVKRLLMRGRTQVLKKPRRKEVMFFNDQIHANLMTQLDPEHNYVKLDTYIYEFDPDAMKGIFKEALNDGGILSELLPEFLAYAQPCGNRMLDCKGNIDCFLNGMMISRGGAYIVPPDTPNGSNKMLEFLSQIDVRNFNNNATNANYNANSEGNGGPLIKSQGKMSAGKSRKHRTHNKRKTRAHK